MNVWTFAPAPIKQNSFKLGQPTVMPVQCSMQLGFSVTSHNMPQVFVQGVVLMLSVSSINLKNNSNWVLSFLTVSWIPGALKHFAARGSFAAKKKPKSKTTTTLVQIYFRHYAHIQQIIQVWLVIGTIYSWTFQQQITPGPSWHYL